MTDSARLRGAPRVAGAAAVAVLLAGCGPGSSPHVASSRGPTAPATSAVPGPGAHRHHAPYSDVNPPPRRGGGFVVKVLSVSRLEPAADGHPLEHRRAGRDYWGEEVRTCLTRANDQARVVGWSDWRAEAVDGRTFAARPVTSEPLRTPTYPFHRRLAPGECATGWWLIPLPRGTGVDTIQLAPGGGGSAIVWRTLR